MYITRKTVSIKLVRFKDAFAQYDINILQIVDGIENGNVVFSENRKKKRKVGYFKKTFEWSSNISLTGSAEV